MKKIILFLLFSIPVMATAQLWKPETISVSLLDNSTLLPPASLTAVFNQPLHPGFLLANEFGWKEHQTDMGSVPIDFPTDM